MAIINTMQDIERIISDQPWDRNLYIFEQDLIEKVSDDLLELFVNKYNFEWGDEEPKINDNEFWNLFIPYEKNDCETREGVLKSPKNYANYIIRYESRLADETPIEFVNFCTQIHKNVFFTEELNEWVLDSIRYILDLMDNENKNCFDNIYINHDLETCSDFLKEDFCDLFCDKIRLDTDFADYSMQEVLSAGIICSQYLIVQEVKKFFGYKEPIIKEFSDICVADEQVVIYQ